MITYWRMIYTNNYIEKKPKNLIRFAMVFYLCFTLAFIAVMFVYKTEQQQTFACVFTAMAKDQASPGSVSCMVVIPQMAKTGIDSMKSYAVRFASANAKETTARVMFTGPVSGSDTARAILTAEQGALPESNKIDGFITVGNGKKKNLFQQMISK